VEAGIRRRLSARWVPLEPQAQTLAVDTFLESWHVPVRHRPTVARVPNEGAAVVDPFGPNPRLVFPFRSVAAQRDPPEAEGSLVHHALMIYALFSSTGLITAEG
jgi:hypothetical protein